MINNHDFWLTALLSVVDIDKLYGLGLMQYNKLNTISYGDRSLLKNLVLSLFLSVSPLTF
jgi:hypothetical protein